MTNLVSATSLISDAGNIVQHTVFSLLAVHFGLDVTRSLLPCARLLADAGSKIVQYTLVSLLAVHFGLDVARSLLPSARMDSLERLIAETADLLDKAREERVLSNREFNFEIQLKLSRALEDKSMLRSRVLCEFGLSHSAQEYLHILGGLSRSIQQCTRDVKDIKLAVLTEVEKERHIMYGEDIKNMIILGSDLYATATKSILSLHLEYTVLR
ncbi:hypothetical protein GGX14DRAFT_646985 [Mycena pura]|uniref:Uncharacterized protein n=1 Tax=Mycena pura TaxID=153505 RepID=A0AAD6V7J9_9AGAR|nr:hypothetical protein GGX14DRAFT_646985 [Mycena pura]